MIFQRRIVASLLVALLLVLSGCVAQIEAPAAPVVQEEAAPTEVPAAEAAEEASSEDATDATGEMTEDAVAAAVDAYLSTIPEGFMALSLDSFKDLLATGQAVVIDVREPGEYEAGHVEGAINIPIRDVAQNLDLIPTDMPVVVYCASGHRAGLTTSALRTLGYENVRAFPGGWKAWSAAEEPVSTDPVEGAPVDVPDLDPTVVEAVDGFLSTIPEGYYAIGTVDALSAAMDAGAAVVDVREPREFEEGAITGAVNIPVREVAARSAEIPMDQPVIVYCASGFRAALATSALHIMGFENVRSFPPGYGAWEAAEVAGTEVPAEVEEAETAVSGVVESVDAFLAGIPEGYMAVGQLDAFNEMLDATDVYLIDVREEGEYAEGHLPGAVNIPMRTLTQNLDQIPTDQPVMLYCASGHRAGMSLAALRILGYENARSFPPGFRGWTAAEEEVSTEAVAPGSFGMPEVDGDLMASVDEFLQNIPEGYYAIGNVDQLAGAIDAGAVLVDVRQPDEYERGHIPGAINIPMRELGANLDAIPIDQPVVVYCASGHRAAVSAAALHAMGYENVRSFPAGYGAWESSGADVEMGQ